VKKSDDHVLLELFERIGSWVLLRPLVRLVEFLFVDLAPAVPKHVLFRRGRPFYIGTFVAGYLVALILCLIVPAVWSYKIGTFSGDEAAYRYFSQDIYNLVLYSLVCPLYVGFGCVLISEVYGGGAELRSLEKHVGVSQLAPHHAVWKNAGLFLFMLAVALGLTTNYILDATNVSRIGATFWFSHFPSSGLGRLNSLGIYYFLLNFTLMFFTIVSLTCYMAAFASVVRVAKALGSYPDGNHITAQEMNIRLVSFTVAWIAARFQVAVYVINYWIWQKSDLGKADNLVITRALLMLVGILFLWIPREYIELQWQRFRQRTGVRDDDIDLNSPVDERLRLVAKVLDTVLIGSIFFIPIVSDFLSD
jgi:hypothetical protein